MNEQQLAWIGVVEIPLLKIQMITMEFQYDDQILTSILCQSSTHSCHRLPQNPA